MEGSAVS